jgi:hypothetical protein
MSNATNASQKIVAYLVATLDRTGTQLLKTRRGARRYAKAVRLEDGSILVSTRHSESQWSELHGLQHLRNSVLRGDVDADTARWDEHEMSLYFRASAEEVQSAFGPTRRAGR